METSQAEVTRGFYSNLFLVPKKDRCVRPVFKLYHLNEFIPPSLQDGGDAHLKDILKKDDWMTKVDLKDAYFMIPIQSENRSALQFFA